MTGRPAYDRDTYLEDLRALIRRGMTKEQAGKALGLSRATVYRILSGK